MSYLVRIENTTYQFTARHDESILSAALRQYVTLPWGCGSGICGVCMGQLVEGEVVYPNGPPLALFEEDAVQGKCLFCVGHARSNLVLNIPEMNT